MAIQVPSAAKLSYANPALLQLGAEAVASGGARPLAHSLPFCGI